MPLNSRLEVRLADEEKFLWGAAAAEAGLTVSEYVRLTVNRSLPPPAAPQPAITNPVVPTTDPPVPSFYGLCPLCERQCRPCCPLCRYLNHVPD
jgi:hypothetical protein